MAINVTTDIATINLCESVTGWSGGDGHLEIDAVRVEGSYSISDWVNATTQSAAYVTGTWDFSNGEHVYVWMFCSGEVDTKANGGYRIYLYDGTTANTYYVGGKDTHPVGWNLFVLDPSIAPDVGSTYNATSLANITRVGVQFKTLSAAIKKGQTFINNCFWDALREGTGLTITSGSTDQITPEDIAAADTVALGIVRIINGAAIVSGKLTFGGTGTETIDFLADNNIIVYPDIPEVSDSLNTILVLGNGTGVTNFNFLGSFMKGLQKPITLTLSGANIDELNMLGSTLVVLGESHFTSGQLVEDCVFAQSKEINPQSAEFNRVTIKDTEETATGSLNLTTVAEAELCTNMTFNTFSNSYAVYIAAGITAFDMDNWQFDDPDNTASYAVYWAGTVGTLTISAKNGTNLVSAGCTSAGGTVVVATSSTLKLTVKNEAGVAVGSAYAYIDDNNITPFIMNTTTNVTTGIAEVSWTGGAVSAATWRVRKYGYKPWTAIADVPATGTKDIPVTLIIDPQQT